jgi:hypothetical protein
MRKMVLLALLLAAVSLPAAAAECTCRLNGRDIPLGQSACIPSPRGARIATCGMVLNNTSWQFSDTPCVVSQALDALDVAGKRATLAAELHAGP